MQVKQLLTRTAGAFGVTAGLLFASSPLMAQMKIGDNPNTINPNAILELESAQKGLLLPRVALTATNAVTPMTAPVPEGMHVYNTATTSGDFGVSPGEYYFNGSSWVRLITEVPAGMDVYREGAPIVGGTCGSDPEGTIWNDITEQPDGSISGDRWICKNGVWAVYNAPSATRTPFFLGLSNTVDAGSAKAGTISRAGHIISRRYDNGGSTTIAPGGAIKLLRTLALAPVQGPFIDFGRNAANERLFRVGLRNDLNGGNGALTFATYINQVENTRFVVANNGQVGVNVQDPRQQFHVKGNVLIGAEDTDGSGFFNASSPSNGILLSYGALANTAQISVQNTGNTPNLILSKTDAEDGNIFAIFRQGSTPLGSITRKDAAHVLYGDASDRRLKENIKGTHYAIGDLMKIGVVDYNYKADETKTLTTGFIAQDLYKILPGAIVKGGQDVKANPWMVDYSKLTPLLVKAVQDQQKEIESLKAQLGEMNALKAEVASIKAMLGNAGEKSSEATISK